MFLYLHIHPITEILSMHRCTYDKKKAFWYCYIYILSQVKLYIWTIIKISNKDLVKHVPVPTWCS